MKAWETLKDKVPLTITYTEVKCKFCDSRNVIRYGHFRGVQRWWCKDCQTKFIDNGALPGMRTPTKQITSALNMYYSGLSLNAIRRQLNLDHQNYPSDSTVYEWLDRFTKIATKEADNCHPKVGDTWVADETVLRIDGRNTWFWDIIDVDTRFLLASRVSHSRTKGDAQLLINKAKERAGKAPKVVLTDSLASYLDIDYGKGAEHQQSSPFLKSDSTRTIERFHGTLKDRTKVMRGLKDIKTAREFTDGWLIHYNYFRPHEGLDNKTPGTVAQVKFKYGNWADVMNSQTPIAKRAEPRIRIVRKEPTVPYFDLRQPKVRISAPRRPITPKRRSIRGDIHVGGGMISRHSFRGSRPVRGRLLR